MYKFKKSILYRIIAFFCIVIALGCERDDICATDTPTTPLLVIEFYDNITRTDAKNTTNLQVRALGTTDFFFTSAQNVSTISIPLKTNESATEYEFITNSGEATENIDILSIQYTPEDEFVSSACGFKTTFQGFSITVSNPNGDTTDWILGNERQQVNIINENQAHLFIFH